MKKCDIAIIGGGFCGSILTNHLAFENLTIFQFEKNKYRNYKGIAYTTSYDCHSLNVYNANMSAIHSAPNHFLEYLNKHNLPNENNNFSSRKVYGNYISETVSNSIEESGCDYFLFNQEVVSVNKNDNGFILTTIDEKEYLAATVVLALGIDLGHSPFDVLDTVSVNDKVAIIGSGLSAVDMILSLSSMDLKKQVDVFSRSGKLPVSYPDVPECTENLSWNVDNNILAIFRKVKYLLKKLSLVDIVISIRPYTQSLFNSLDDNNKSRFFRHLYRKYSYYRHRISPTINKKIQKLKQEKFFSLHKKEVTTKLSSEYDKILDCRGLSKKLESYNSPLLQNMLANNLISKGPLGIGIEYDVETGKVLDNLYVLGFLRSGKILESIAIPELSKQCEDLAKLIINIHK